MGNSNLACHRFNGFVRRVNVDDSDDFVITEPAINGLHTTRVLGLP